MPCRFEQEERRRAQESLRMSNSRFAAGGRVEGRWKFEMERLLNASFRIVETPPRLDSIMTNLVSYS